jgi:hypothetical protein
LAFVIARMDELQFKWLQLEVRWKSIEAQEGQCEWGQLDETIGRLSQNSLNLLVTIYSAPEWARSANTDYSVEGPPADPQKYADFVAAFVERYKGQVKAIEIWTGQNLWYNWGHEPIDAGRYTNLLCRAYYASKAIDSSLVVVTGGLVPTKVNDGLTAVDDLVYLQRMYDNGAKKCFDALGAHPEGYNNPPDAKFGFTDPQEPSFKNGPNYFFRETLERYHQIMASNKDTAKRIWPTKFGWASDPNPPAGSEFARDNSQQEQAEYLVRAYQLGKSLDWVGPMFLANLNVGLVKPESDGRIFSLWREGGPTPAYESLKTIQPGR